MRRKRGDNNPHERASWDVHAEWEVTSIQHWHMFKYCDIETLTYEVSGMINFKDLLGGSVRVGNPRAVDDQTFELEFPTLFALMAVTIDEDGKVRKGCSLTIVCEDGVVKAGLNERNYELSLWTSSEDLGGVFVALERACCETPPRWRKKTWDARKK